MRVNDKRRTIERIEMDKAVAAPRENSGERRQVQATAKRKLAIRQRRAQREQPFEIFGIRGMLAPWNTTLANSRQSRPSH